MFKNHLYLTGSIVSCAKDLKRTIWINGVRKEIIIPRRSTGRIVERCVNRFGDKMYTVEFNYQGNLIEIDLFETSFEHPKGGHGQAWEEE